MFSWPVLFVVSVLSPWFSWISSFCSVLLTVFTVSPGAGSILCVLEGKTKSGLDSDLKFLLQNPFSQPVYIFSGYLVWCLSFLLFVCLKLLMCLVFLFPFIGKDPPQCISSALVIYHITYNMFWFRSLASSDFIGEERGVGCRICMVFI